MSSQTAMIQLHLVDYAPQGDVFSTDILPGILALLDPDRVTTTLLPPAETLDGLMIDLPTEPGTWRVVFYDRAEQTVEKALHAGTPPRKALAAWEQEMQALLGFQRKHRRNVLLVDRAAAHRKPQAFAIRLSTFLNINPPKTAAPQSSTGPIASVESIIAAQTVAQSLRARRLNGELDASSLPILEGDENHHCDVDAAFQSYTAEKSHADEAQAAGLKVENDLLVLQLGNVQKELEDYFKRWNAQEEQTSDLESQIQVLKENTTQVDKTHLTLREDLERQQKQHKASEENVKQENSLLVMQLTNVQEELESYFLEAKQLKEACIKHEEKLAILGQESTTAALNVKALSDQLHDTEGKMQETAGHLHTTEDTLKEQGHNLEQAQHNVAQLEGQLHQREDELHHFLQSTSWRVTGPLRRMKDRLSRSKDQEH